MADTATESTNASAATAAAAATNWVQKTEDQEISNLVDSLAIGKDKGSAESNPEASGKQRNQPLRP